MCCTPSGVEIKDFAAEIVTILTQLNEKVKPRSGIRRVQIVRGRHSVKPRHSTSGCGTGQNPVWIEADRQVDFDGVDPGRISAFTGVYRRGCPGGVKLVLC